MVRLNENKALSKLIFSLCQRIKQGVDCDSALPEGCVLAEWNPTRAFASLCAVTMLAAQIILFHLTWILLFYFSSPLSLSLSVFSHL